MVWYGGRLFRPVTTSETSQTSSDTIFKYEQLGWRVTATYSGGDIQFGHLIGIMDEYGVMEARYHHLDQNWELRTGSCITSPEILDNGRLRLHEDWQWTNGKRGKSTLEEI